MGLIEAEINAKEAIRELRKVYRGRRPNSLTCRLILCELLSPNPNLERGNSSAGYEDTRKALKEIYKIGVEFLDEQEETECSIERKIEL